jgi:hypothetical protein
VGGTKNLIMGLWVRQPFRHMEPLIASLHRSGFAGDFCIFVADVEAETVRDLRSHGIIVERAGTSAQPRMAATSSRYFSYLDYLIRDGGDYAKIMLIDPATIVFQSDPFAVPLPSDILYTQLRRRLAELPDTQGGIVQAYGESVAHNMRDCMTSNAAVTIGTLPGMMRYLAAMTAELSAKTAPITDAFDQAVHNYVVHMRPLRDAWLDPDDAIATAVGAVPDETVQISEEGVLVDGRLVPVLACYDSNAKVHEHVVTSPQFQLAGLPPSAGPQASPHNCAVIAFYHRERDAALLKLFLGSLRCVADTVEVHCIGDFNAEELAVLSHYDCAAHPVAPVQSGIAENVAHFYLSQLLDRLVADRKVLPDQVLLLDSVGAAFGCDPFLNRTIGLSVFCEGPTRIADSAYNRDRLAFFVRPEESSLQLPVVSSALLRGSVSVVREFYRQLFSELVGRQDLLKIPKVVQGAFNKLCHLGQFDFPVVIHPNAADVCFDFWPSDLAIDTRRGVRVGGSVPSVVLTNRPDTKLMRRLRIDLSLSEI